ncbi:hypothetical protein V5799_021085 [Amblyomma americanum]|uniref:Uncharacterized protein n=1 Tax=Amblyomma americanum TaxID=6943 RepID=A0AAQ4FPJ6_AMBAM
MSGSRIFSRLASNWGPKKAKPDLVWHRPQQSLVDIRLPGLESGETVKDSFLNRLLSLKRHLSERPRPSWLHVTMLPLAGFAILCTTLWLLVSLDWPFVPEGNVNSVARRKDVSHKGNGTAPPPLGSVKSQPALRPAPSKSARLETSEMDRVPSSTNMLSAYAGSEPTLSTNAMAGDASLFRFSEETVTEQDDDSITTDG